MGKHLRSFGILPACIMLAACADDDPEELRYVNEVDVRMSQDTDFSKYQTFAVVGRGAVPDRFLDGLSDKDITKIERMNEAARNELEDLGLMEVEPGEDPDLQAFSLAASEDRTVLAWECVAGYWRGYWDWNWDPCRWLERDYDTVDVRTLITGLVDPEREEVVFVGFVNGVEDVGVEPDDVVEDAVDKIYDEYP